MAKIPYIKPSLSIRKQVDLLESRGIIIPNKNEAEHFLRYHNYYHVSGYVFYFESKWLPVIPGMESRLASFLPMIFHLLLIIQKDTVSKNNLIPILTSKPLIRPKDMGLQSCPKAGTSL